ncbi:MAG: hypothetical protein AB7O49_15655 [Sphingomonadales bacterium]
MFTKASILATLIAFGAVLSSAPALALYDPSVPGLTYTGLAYSAPFGAAHRTAVEGAIETSLLPGADAYFVGRLNSTLDQGETGAGSPVFASSLDGMCLDAGCTTGTWSFDPDASNFVIAFLEISAGGNAYLFKLDEFGLLGNWNTGGLNDLGKALKEVSHMDFYAVAGSGSTRVPEPGILLVLAIGMTALAGIHVGRRRPGAAA